MIKTTNTTWMGFLLAISTVAYCGSSHATTADSIKESLNPLENRISRIAEVLKEREKQLQQEGQSDHNFTSDIDDNLIAGGWGNGRGGSWVDTNRGSFVNNRRGWDNWRGWDDWGRWTNRSPWRNGGGFLNRR
ncbi:GrrA/OscA1 family cyclophane-containing rSAM-modified RiPP [Cyanobacterium aponinum AL20118]|uniref:GrrA/OscA1 family cyclophane-containing rSAM-modified RiPP n=1 Tax=Cyanobacterium aponinum AL20115 TaxID=3090662 RepID=A0AAF1C387_9CHRO|nr:GrrA/OscA1 family cyclophane-containing rSAM-modified RiPP [Cyanobacterium aponinum]WPF89513.1 GrrA/OscA1 family cyclophane-containing rSAM-modified RiPP [Cyanobacterium aponinum AL20115]